MAKRRSTVADYLKAHPQPLQRKGGQGVRGRLSLWLIEEWEPIAQGRAEGRLGWAEVATIAAKAGVHGPDGQPINPQIVSNKWNALLRKGIVRNVPIGVPLLTMPSWPTAGGSGSGTDEKPATASPPVPRFDLPSAKGRFRPEGAATSGNARADPSPGEDHGVDGRPIPPAPRPAVDLGRWILADQARKGLT